MKKPAHYTSDMADPKGSDRLSFAATSIVIYLDPATDWYGSSSGKRGRSRTFNKVAIDFCWIVGYILNLPLRRAIEQTKDLLKLAKLDWEVPDYSTVSRRTRQQWPAVGFLRHRQYLHLFVCANEISAALDSDNATTIPSQAYERRWRMVRLHIKK